MNIMLIHASLFFFTVIGGKIDSWTQLDNLDQLSKCKTCMLFKYFVSDNLYIRSHTL